MAIDNILALFLLALFGSISDKVNTRFGKRTPFITVGTVIAAVALIACSLIFRAKEKKTHTLLSPVKIVQPVWGYVAVMSVCLFLNSYFKTTAAIYLDASQLYPLNQGLVIVLSAIMAAIFFKEKITARCLLGMVIAFAGLIFINVL
jgi:drug/metabolite transporter (DMT)-like permease